MTALEIVDSAVKIGLGAAISAAAGYFTLRLNHKHELRKVSDERKLALLERVAEHFEKFNAAFVAYLCVIPVSGCPTGLSADMDVARTQLQQDVTPENLVAAKAKAKDAQSAATELTAALSILYLLGRSTALDALRNYKTQAERFWLETSQQKAAFEAARFLELRKQVSAAKQTFYDELSKLYPVKA